MNYKKTKKERKGRGARGSSGRKNFANVFHLKRILLFLRENPKEYFTKSDMIKACLVGGIYIDDAMKFLIREGFVTQTYRKQKDRFGKEIWAKSNIKVYSIK